MCLKYEQIQCHVWQWRIFTRWKHQFVSALRTISMLRLTVEYIHQIQYEYVSELRTVTMLRMTMESIHQVAISLCVRITNNCHVTYDNGGCSPDGNISMCLHYEQLPCYVWYWRVFTRCQYQYVSVLRTDIFYVWQWRVLNRWQYQYVFALRTVTILRKIVESIHQMAISVCVCINIGYQVTYGSGEYL